MKLAYRSFNARAVAIVCVALIAQAHGGSVGAANRPEGGQTCCWHYRLPGPLTATAE